MKKRIAAVLFVICIVVLLMLTAGFEQSDRLSELGYISLSAFTLGGMYISGTAAGLIEKEENACRTEKSDKRSERKC